MTENANKTAYSTMFKISFAKIVFLGSPEFLEVILGESIENNKKKNYSFLKSWFSPPFQYERYANLDSSCLKMGPHAVLGKSGKSQK